MADVNMVLIICNETEKSKFPVLSECLCLGVSLFMSFTFAVDQPFRLFRGMTFSLNGAYSDASSSEILSEKMS